MILYAGRAINYFEQNFYKWHIIPNHWAEWSPYKQRWQDLWWGIDLVHASLKCSLDITNTLSCLVCLVSLILNKEIQRLTPLTIKWLCLHNYHGCYHWPHGLTGFFNSTDFTQLTQHAGAYPRTLKLCPNAITRKLSTKRINSLSHQRICLRKFIGKSKTHI